MEIARERYDVLIIGSGGGGLRAALAAAAAGARVAVLTKGEPARSGGTLSAHWSFCAVLPEPAPGDSPEVFAADILRSGEQIPDPDLVAVLAERAAEAVAYAQSLGVRFDPVEKGSSRPHLGWLAGHSYPRALHVGNAVGREMIRVLLQAVGRAGVAVYPFTLATDLLVQDGVLAGALALDLRTGAVRLFEAPAVVLATGGGSQAYALNTNPFEATGDGYAMAYRAGVELVDMEFVQFYPTVLVWPPGARGLMFNSGILIPKGATLLNKDREEFWDRYQVGPLKAATRDLMCRVMSLEIAAGGGTAHGGLYMSVRGIDPRELPQMQHRLMADVGLPAEVEEREVAPGAHYFMGGLRIDTRAASSLPGLFAAGECAGGIHGANRLAGNALSENQVFGELAGRHAAAYAKGHPLPAAVGSGPALARVLEPVQALLSRAGRGDGPREYLSAVQSLMHGQVGPTRTEEGLAAAIAGLRRLREEVAVRLGPREAALPYNRDLARSLEVRNLIDTGLAIALAARERTESRGAHLRLDYPEQLPEWTCSLVLQPGPAGDRLVRIPRRRPAEVRQDG